MNTPIVSLKVIIRMRRGENYIERKIEDINQANAWLKESWPVLRFIFDIADVYVEPIGDVSISEI